MNINIGGEHIILPSHLLKKSKGYINSLIRTFKDDYYVNFTFGGYYSLLAIIDSIKVRFENDSKILLPSYLCPSILKSFKLRGIQYRFYKVDDNLFIDTDYLSSIIDDKVKAVVFIDYFGSSQLDRIKPVLDALASRKIIIIQDLVQCLEIKKELLFGDYIFNSFRKFFPFEGSILLSKDKMNIVFNKNPKKYLLFKRTGQLLRFYHIEYHMFSSKCFLPLLIKAEENYCSNYILKAPKFNIKQLNKYDIEKILQQNCYYYNLFLKAFNSYVPDLLKKNNFIPLGFIMKVPNRDQIRKKLSEQNIFAPIHWILPPEVDKSQFHESTKLSSLILTIPLINLNESKFEFLFENLTKVILNESIP